MKVIGAGYGRTGTMSLKLALEQLGLGPCYHMVEVFKDPKAPQLWLDAAEGRPDWATIFEGYNSTVDWPNATFYAELAEAYPDAKVILTERDPEAWFASTQATIFSRDFPEDTADTWQRMALKVISDLFDRRMHDKDHVISVYRAHNARVREVIPAERLLVYQVAEGWAPLCEFLGVAVPAGPMPKVNSTEEFQMNLAKHLEDSPPAVA
ncbi:MAG: sulfotransferase family protein [Phenylobacterium sp.]|nr:MAG: sulfotransferase family protein [Phenylobacterium sp.]